MDDEDKFKFFNWKCPSCDRGTCAVVQLSEDFETEVAQLDEAIMLEPVELEILAALDESGEWMRAGEISLLIDCSYQLVGRRTSRLQDQDLVRKQNVDGHRQSKITKKARDIYFGS